MSVDDNIDFPVLISWRQLVLIWRQLRGLFR